MSTPAQQPLLHKINSPADLRQLSGEELEAVAVELREFIIQSVSVTGGHLASSLGAVELSIALHYVFDTPDDRLVWDVGHQSYPHKILTGRRDLMHSIRKRGGIAGFPKRDESPYDTFGVGHSSTSISAALGMAIAASKENKNRKVVAIIGDGAMTAGQAFEALNHAGDLGENLLVILNDNDMSISQNVGGLSNYLARILSGKFYTSVRESGKKMLSNMPPMRELARRAEEHMKGMVIPGTLFEELGFNYIGPIDGHDLQALTKTLTNLKALQGPQLLHVATRKGQGFAPAEDNPCAYHGVGPFDPVSGKLKKSASPKKSYTQVFSDWICEIAKQDSRVVAITPAMREGSGLVEFSEKFPDRFFDVGIGEQHSLTFAAGLACEGYRPVVAIYSTFLQRAYDQLVHDIAIQNLPVTFAIDRAGLVGPDGPTHAGSFDFSFLRCVPNMIVMAPADENECRQLLLSAHGHDGPAAVRYPRGAGPGKAVDTNAKAIAIGTSATVVEGQQVAILAFGSMVQTCVEAGSDLGVTIVNMRFVKPLDESRIIELASQHELLVTVEENALAGGAGSAVNECLAAHGVTIPVVNVGIPDRFVSHGSREELLSECGLDSESIRAMLSGWLENNHCQNAARQLIS